MPITTDPARLQAVAGQLGTAMRDGKVRLPVIQASDVAGLVMVMHGRLDAAIDERSAAAKAQGLNVACSAGCSSCCVSPLLVTEGEAVTVAEWLKLPEHADERARFAASYPAWKRGVGDAGEALARAKTDDERRAAAMQLKHKGAMCAFNHDGLCGIYEARPARCRRAHALDTNANCGVDGGGEVKYYEHPLAEETFEEQEPMRAVLHKALRPGGNLDLLCAAVTRLLAAEVGRNDPCPCGSGQKYKRCCGA